jgi:uncharacterized OsmC-like protein
MTGTLAGALEARHIAAYDGSLETEVEGDIEKGENKVLLRTKVHIKCAMKIPQGLRAQAERALALHHARCPVSQSVERGIRIEWSAEISEV